MWDAACCLVPGVVTYNAAITMCKKKGQAAEHGFERREVMPPNCLVPTVVSSMPWPSLVLCGTVGRAVLPRMAEYIFITGTSTASNTKVSFGVDCSSDDECFSSANCSKQRLRALPAGPSAS